MAGWFGRFPAATEAREDIYLLGPPLRGLSVKIRGGRALEVKAYRGSAGFLEVAGRARGHLESWQKWSFPYRPPHYDRGAPPGWQPVRKKRRISRFTLDTGPGGQPHCDVELTEVRARGRDWWTLGFEATGPPGLLRGAPSGRCRARVRPGPARRRGTRPGPLQVLRAVVWATHPAR